METHTILIRTDASDRIGAGHIMRCLAIANAARASGLRAVFVTCELHEIFERRVRSERYEFYRINAVPCSIEDVYQTLKIAEQVSAATVIVDLYDCTPEYLENLSEGLFITLCVDDNAYLNRYPVDFVLNSNGHAEYAHYTNKITPKTRLLLGPRYALLRHEFLAFRDWQRPTVKPCKILLSLGGGNQVPVFVRIIERMVDVLKPFELSFVIARPDFDIASLEATARRHRLSYQFVIAPTNMAAEFANHDTLISSGGSTVWEALYMQIPGMFVAIVENQVNSCTALKKMIVHPVFTSIEDIQPDAFNAIVQDTPLRNSLVQSGRSIVDGFGAERVISEIFNS